MRFVIDAHVHLYPCHALPALLDALWGNLRRLDPGAAPAALLAERAGINAFARLRAGAAAADLGPWRARPGDSPDCLVLEDAGAGRSLLVAAGRQVATRERLEILGLGRDADVADGLSADETIRRLAGQGALPVLSWAPGKWLFGRAPVVARLVREFCPDRLLLGDTSLRPRGWGEPVPMRRARRAGAAVLAGSDPLPVPGEERQAGRYACRIEVTDAAAPGGGAALLDALRRAPRVERLGRRGGAVETLLRLRRYRAAGG